jgi:hypothetical protein
MENLAVPQETSVVITMPPSQGSRRIPQLDSLRGLLLVWMTLTHLPTRASQYTNQALGYISAAEGFILLAAVLTGQLHRHETEEYGVAAARERLFRRALRIYKYHLILLAIAFGLCGIAAVYLHRIPLQYLLDFYLQKPQVAVIAAPALLYNPPLLDILPMYIVFMLMTPMVLWVAKRQGWMPVLGVSVAVWLLAQFNLRGWLYSSLAHFGFPIPLGEMGAFDILAWQFLWTGGLALGSVRREIRLPKAVLIVSGFLAAALFLCRHAPFDALTGPGLFDVLVDKWRLAILRLIDLASVGVLAVKFGAPLANSRLGMRLGRLGRASLEVFCVQIFFCFVFLALGNGRDSHFTWWQDGMILAITFSGLFWIVWFIEQSRRRDPEQRTRWQSLLMRL